MLTKRSDVYSFGMLIMEVITGRSPVDYGRPSGEVNLVEWLKSMFSNRNSESVLDPKISERPSFKVLKRALLVALRCVDPDAQKRPKMGNVIHMLEMDDLLFCEDRRIGCEASHSRRDHLHENQVAKLTAKQLDNDDASEGENNNKGALEARWR